jgi:hypothetical protein
MSMTRFTQVVSDKEAAIDLVLLHFFFKLLICDCVWIFPLPMVLDR